MKDNQQSENRIRQKSKPYVTCGFLALGVIALTLFVQATIRQSTSKQTPTPALSPTITPFEDGEYIGTDPSISINVYENKVTDVDLYISYENDGTHECWLGFPFYDGWEMTNNQDGSFVFHNKAKDMVISGQIAGKTIQGKYTIASCGSTNRDGGHSYTEMVPPLEGEWSAALDTSIAVPPSTLTPLAPPKAGHFTGNNPTVAFDITSDGIISKFTLSVPTSKGTCELSQDGFWQLGAYNSGYFTAYFGDQATTISGFVEDQLAKGSYHISNCGSFSFDNFNSPFGEWSAYWVGP